MGADNPATSGNQDTGSELDVLNAEDTSEETTEETTTEEETSTTEEKEETTDEEVTDDETIEETSSEELDETDDDTSKDEPDTLSWQAIKKDHPEIAKDKRFKEVFFREKAYTEVFPTVSDAQEAATKAERLDVVDNLLIEGDVETLFSNLDVKVLENISTKFLPSLFKTNKELYKTVARPIVVDAFHHVMGIAEETNDENLKKSIRNVVRTLTGKPELPSRTVVTSDPAVEEQVNKLKKERSDLFLKDQSSFLGYIEKTTVKRIEQIITEGLDPKNELNDFTKKAVIKATVADVHKALATNPELRSKLQQLHRSAIKSRFADEYKSRMIAATLDRARKLIPVLRNKHRTAALGKQSTKGKTDKEKIVTTTEKVTTSPSRVNSVKQIDTLKTSELDFLNDKVITRK